MVKALEVNNLSFCYNDQNKVLDNITFSIESGNWVTIFGRNGSGKSTLAKLLVGLEFTSGKIKVFWNDLTIDNVNNIRDNIGIVFQNPENQFVGDTVKDDISFGLINKGLSEHNIKDKVKEVLKEVKMSEFINEKPENLSGGQKQRIALADALVLRPKILMLDETTSMLDPLSRKNLLSLIRNIQKKYELTVIAITHDVNEALYSDQIIILNMGEISFCGDQKSLFKRDKLLLY